MERYSEFLPGEFAKNPGPVRCGKQIIKILIPAPLGHWAGPDKLWNILTEYIRRMKNTKKVERDKKKSELPMLAQEKE